MLIFLGFKQLNSFKIQILCDRSRQLRWETLTVVDSFVFLCCEALGMPRPISEEIGRWLPKCAVKCSRSALWWGFYRQYVFYLSVQFVLFFNSPFDGLPVVCVWHCYCCLWNIDNQLSRQFSDTWFVTVLLLAGLLAGCFTICYSGYVM